MTGHVFVMKKPVYTFDEWKAENWEELDAIYREDIPAIPQKPPFNDWCLKFYKDGGLQ